MNIENKNKVAQEKKQLLDNKTESRMMSFFNNEFLDRKLDFKPKKQYYKEVISQEIKELFPESVILEDLFKLEEEIDETVLKSRLRVQEKLMKPANKIQAKLQSHLFLYYFDISTQDSNMGITHQMIDSLIQEIKSKEKADNEEVYNEVQIDLNNDTQSSFYENAINNILGQKELFWTLKFQGKVSYKKNDLEESSINQVLYRKFSYFFNKIVFKFETFDNCPPIKDVEWIRNPGVSDTDGFEIKRSIREGIPKSVKILYYLNNNSQKYKITNKNLAELLGIEQETRSKILFHIWQYIKLNSLQDKENNGVVMNNKYLRRIFGVERMELNSLPNRLIHFIEPIELIMHSIECDLDLKPQTIVDNELNLYQEKILSIDIFIDDPNFLDITHVLSNLENETLLFPKSFFLGKAEGVKNDKLSRVELFYNSIAEHDKTISEMMDKMNKYKYNYDFYKEFSKDPTRFIDNFKVQQDGLLKLIKDEYNVIDNRFDFGSAEFYKNYEVNYFNLIKLNF